MMVRTNSVTKSSESAFTSLRAGRGDMVSMCEDAVMSVLWRSTGVDHPVYVSRLDSRREGCPGVHYLTVLRLLFGFKGHVVSQPLLHTGSSPVSTIGERIRGIAEIAGGVLKLPRFAYPLLWASGNRSPGVGVDGWLGHVEEGTK